MAKPLVVLGGWLGCQSRFLQKYISLYESLGMNVLPVIASPHAIVEATFHTGFSQTSERQKGTLSSMEECALEVMADIKLQEAHVVFFHVFSNGGCFLWEHLRRTMDATSDSHNQVRNLQANRGLKTKIKGVVFDSCPAWFGEDTSVLSTALNHCSEDEKNAIRKRFGPGVLCGEDKEQRKVRIQRNREYFEFLRDDRFDIPQLYLYCKNDSLSDYGMICDLIVARTNKCTGPIIQRQWVDSVHCAHLLKHPKDYAQAICDFTALALRNSNI